MIARTYELYVLARTFGLGVLDLDTVTVQHFLTIMEEETKVPTPQPSS